MVIVATARAGEITRVLLTVIPLPLKDALVTPFTKLVSAPVMVTSRVDPDLPDAGSHARAARGRVCDGTWLCSVQSRRGGCRLVAAVIVVVVTGAAVMVNAARAGQLLTLGARGYRHIACSYWRIRGNGNSWQQPGLEK